MCLRVNPGVSEQITDLFHEENYPWRVIALYVLFIYCILWVNKHSYLNIYWDVGEMWYLFPGKILSRLDDKEVISKLNVMFLIWNINKIDLSFMRPSSCQQSFVFLLLWVYVGWVPCRCNITNNIRLIESNIHFWSKWPKYFFTNNITYT